MERCFFPVIECQEHAGLYDKGDEVVKKEADKIHDTVIIELITIQ